MNAASSVMPQAHPRAQSWPIRIFGSWALWLSLALSVFAFNFVRALVTPIPEPLPVLGTLSSFALVDQHGESFGSEQLAGKAWVANFIFTRCPTVCPAFTAKMGEIQHRSRGLGDSFHLVSFSVDPKYDTPAVLQAYAKEHRASSGAWSFLTGSLESIKATVVEGLKIAMGNNSPDGNFAGIFHGSHFVLVDPKGQIRGYYDSNDADAVDRVLRDAGWLLNVGFGSDLAS